MHLNFHYSTYLTPKTLKFNGYPEWSKNGSNDDFSNFRKRLWFVSTFIHILWKFWQNLKKSLVYLMSFIKTHFPRTAHFRKPKNLLPDPSLIGISEMSLAMKIQEKNVKVVSEMFYAFYTTLHDDKSF